MEGHRKLGNGGESFYFSSFSALMMEVVEEDTEHLTA